MALSAAFSIVVDHHRRGKTLPEHCILERVGEVAGVTRNINVPFDPSGLSHSASPFGESTNYRLTRRLPSPLGRDAMGQRRGVHHRCFQNQPMERRCNGNDLSRSLVAFDQNSTLVAVVELSLNRWWSKACAWTEQAALEGAGS